MMADDSWTNWRYAFVLFVRTLMYRLDPPTSFLYHFCVFVSVLARRGGYRPGDYKTDGQGGQSGSGSSGNNNGGSGRMLGGGSGLKRKGKKKATEGEETAMEKFIKKFGTGTGNAGSTKVRRGGGG